MTRIGVGRSFGQGDAATDVDNGVEDDWILLEEADAVVVAVTAEDLVI